jgi:hypothetical protein
MVEKLNFLNALMEQSHNRAPVKLASNALNDVLYNNNTPLANKPAAVMRLSTRMKQRSSNNLSRKYKTK